MDSVEIEDPVLLDIKTELLEFDFLAVPIKEPADDTVSIKSEIEVKESSVTSENEHKLQPSYWNECSDSDQKKNFRMFEKCESCNEIFFHHSHLTKHRKSQCEDRPFSCTVCNKRYRVKKNLRNHLKIHHNITRYICTVCNKGFNYRSDLHRHSSTIHGEELFYSCRFCSRTFKRLSVLVQHRKQMHMKKREYSTVPVWFECHFCGIYFQTKRDLEEHFRTCQIRNGIASIPKSREETRCSKCKKSFCSKQTLEHHMQTHLRVYQCSERKCKKTFTTKELLNEHKKKHEKDEFYIPHPCSICSIIVTKKEDLDIHSKIHAEHSSPCTTSSKQKNRTSKPDLSECSRTELFQPHPCPVCKIIITSQRDVGVHLKIHGGILLRRHEGAREN